MMSLASTVMGLCFTMYPILAQLIKNAYGFRGCLALIAAINMHTLVGMLVMHPLEWHSKRVNVNNELLINSKILSALLTLSLITQFH